MYLKFLIRKYLESCTFLNNVLILNLMIIIFFFIVNITLHYTFLFENTFIFTSIKVIIYL